MTDSGSPAAPPPAPPDWTGFARAGEWRRALAAARLTGADHAAGLLEAVLAVQDGLRARRLGPARRSAGRLRELLEAAGASGEAALLGSLTRPRELDGALDALADSGETDPGTLRERLAPALAHPLTRAEALNMLGVLHALREEPGEARTLFGGALEADAGHYRAGTNLGNLDLEAGRPAEAEARYREVLRLSPEYDGAHHNLGVALRRQGRLQESVRSIRHAQRLGNKRLQESSREDLRDQFRSSEAIRRLRWGLIAGAAGLLWLLLRGQGG
ncbi:tetratricopeptide (TPR) repeat protein [Deinococcus budaensis]|uniref:Tetratricopeptide (TPR) repeat protein n=1 Tax=Deinococcus budaensis TaxID=1665626 RepID=A0A7W8LNV5_9DEIO|nr:tetratricopeptide repeat protein [Deinococcus budaensis]MBB5232957.1 tetratricopeptide (TPR) repeat protein [Deinococcus budaensis]